MKKKIFLVSALIAMAVSAMFVGCKDKNEAEDSSDINGCKCTFYYSGEKIDTEKFDLDEMEDYYDVKTCSKLQKSLNKELEYYDYSAKCKEY